MDRKKRNKINIFEQKRVEEKPRESDKDYLDAIEEEIPSKTRKKRLQKEYVRHTFIIHPEDLKELQDIVHTVKSDGNYKYTQKEALNEAISLLREEIRKKYGEIKSYNESESF